MRIVSLRMIQIAAFGMLGGLAGAQAASTQECPCFHYNGAQVHQTYTEYSAKNDCPVAVNFRSKAAQIGWTRWFDKGETKTWRCDGGADMCGEIVWKRFDDCPTGAQDVSEPQRSKSSARKSGHRPGSRPRKPADQPESSAPAR